MALGRYLDTSAIQADVQPGYVQLLAKGRLLQLELPAEVRPDAAVARRSKTTGNLLITMPLADAQGCLRPAAAAAGPAAEAGVENAAGACNRPGRGRGGGNGKAAAAEAELPAAVLSAVEGEGDDCQDSLPPL